MVLTYDRHFQQVHEGAMKLDRLIAHEAGLGRIAALRAIAAGRVQVDARAETDRHAPVDRYREVRLDGVESIGGRRLPENLRPGAWRELEPEEVSLAQESGQRHEPTP